MKSEVYVARTGEMRNAWENNAGKAERERALGIHRRLV
jgi:hypothetical protein